MSVFYEIVPLDTLFFRGSVPMEAGQNAAVSMFPPPVSVFEGAIRTAALKQSNIDLKKYAEGKETSLNSIIGSPGEKPPFMITSICIKKDGMCYVRPPASWFLDSKTKSQEKSDYMGKNIISAEQNNFLLENMFVQSSVSNPPFVRAEYNLQPLSNIWISADFLSSSKNQLEEKDFLLQSEIYAFENRTGVALDEKKHTVESQLYSACHVRLFEGISIVVSVSKDVGLEDSGIFLLGGERRICSYKKIDSGYIKDFSFESNEFLSIVPIEANEENLKSVVASSKLLTVSGWDLAKGFHKPTSSWIPAGAVFSKNINNVCIPLRKI